MPNRLYSHIPIFHRLRPTDSSLWESGHSFWASASDGSLWFTCFTQERHWLDGARFKINIWWPFDQVWTRERPRPPPWSYSLKNWTVLTLVETNYHFIKWPPYPIWAMIIPLNLTGVFSSFLSPRFLRLFNEYRWPPLEKSIWVAFVLSSMP